HPGAADERLALRRGDVGQGGERGAGVVLVELPVGVTLGRRARREGVAALPARLDEAEALLRVGRVGGLGELHVPGDRGGLAAVDGAEAARRRYHGQPVEQARPGLFDQLTPAREQLLRALVEVQLLDVAADPAA